MSGAGSRQSASDDEDSLTGLGPDAAQCVRIAENGQTVPPPVALFARKRQKAQGRKRAERNGPRERNPRDNGPIRKGEREKGKRNLPALKKTDYLSSGIRILGFKLDFSTLLVRSHNPPKVEPDVVSAANTGVMGFAAFLLLRASRDSRHDGEKVREDSGNSTTVGWTKVGQKVGKAS